MNWGLISILIITLFQTIVCGLNLSWIFTITARLIFLIRYFGGGNKTSVCLKLEAFSAGMLLLFKVVGAIRLSWIKVLMFVLFSVISCIVMFIDDSLYVYVTEDLEEDDDSNEYN